MTGHIREENLQLVAQEDLSTAVMRYKAVTFNGTIAADSKRAAGLLKYTATSGGNITVILEGVTKADLGGGGITTPGWPLKVITSGWLGACASGDLSVGRFYGQTAASSGDRIPVLVDFKLPAGQWLG